MVVVDVLLLCVCAFRVVAESLHGPRSVGPLLLEILARSAVHAVCTVPDRQLLFGLLVDSADGDRGHRREDTSELVLVLLADLEDSAEFFVEEGLDEILRTARLGDLVKRQAGSTTAGKHHLNDSSE